MQDPFLKPPDISFGGQVETLEPVLKELEIQRLNPPGNDERIVAFSEAAHAEIHDPASYKFRNVLTRRLLPDLKNRDLELKTYKAEKLRVATQVFGLEEEWNAERTHPQFPLDFLETGAWRKLFAWIMEDSERTDVFAYDLWVRDIDTNVPQRYVNIPIVVGMYRALHPDRFTSPPNILDAGTGQGWGLDRLASGKAFQTVEIVQKRGSYVWPLEAATDFIGKLISAEFPIGKAYGVDVVARRWDYPLAPKWTRACRRPKELLETDLLVEFEALLSRGIDPGVELIEWDITRPAEADQLGVEVPIDMIFASNIMYQISREKRAAAIRNLCRLASDEALFESLEFARSATLGGGPWMYGNRYKKLFRHRAFLSDLNVPDNRMPEFLRYTDGRCRQAVLGPLAVRMMNELEIPLK